ncbi:MAG TPA: helix-turn-helix transcriptional regulator [Hyphomicrobiaceae bacterium]|nr:helix-turn-helix transcriptional regulator [Hyphomicrobiaceae bacterium]
MPNRRQARADVNSALAAALTRLRGRASLTQSEVARRMGTTQTAIARLESGAQNPTIKTVQDYVRATGFSLRIQFVRPADPAELTADLLLAEDDP